ncbi:Purine nucleoside phosphorylase [Erysiphe neolycopersici]|uniref:purine-nucleoside phosphorylase n=1 Tax=Erysiphe neolycopersici TaxID=212602 RepID=A0A420I3P4_9PEZI|nr:Purine nucleoside phosphorylase [Erysiphe neolycopersici]
MAFPSISLQPGQSQVDTSAQYIRSLLPKCYEPTVAIIGGSGLSALEGIISSFDMHSRIDPAKSVQEDRQEISFDQLIGFPIPSVSGHAGKLIFGTIVTRNGKKINAVLMSGRAHFYEGNDPKKATFPVRVLGALNIKVLIVTNAAGGLNREYRVGDIMVINDVSLLSESKLSFCPKNLVNQMLISKQHFSFPSLSGSYNPLLGPIDESSAGPGHRFLALSDAYDYNLRRAAWQAWKKISPSQVSGAGNRFQITDADRERRLQEGTYAMVAGPTYETRAESRLLSILGADVVGMSTVPEVIVARHIGVRVLGLTLITNLAVLDKAPRGDDILEGNKNVKFDISAGKANHVEVLEAGKVAAEIMKDLIIEILETDETI